MKKRFVIPVLLAVSASIGPSVVEGAEQSAPTATAGQARGSNLPVRVNPLREAYYGDLHLHTSYSYDAYLMGGTAVDPDEAYRFAKGEVIDYLGQAVRRREPLDFMAVTDHAESIGVFNRLADERSAISRSSFGQKLRAFLASITTPDGRRDFAHESDDWVPFELALWVDYVSGRVNKLPPNLKSESQAAWAREIAIANRNYAPGSFTTFIAYEWTAAPNAANLHRNVIFKGNSAPDPFSAFDSKDPQDLWEWLEAIRKKGIEALAIPHNGNASNGLMYDWVTGGDYMDRRYAEERQANEPVSEIAQNKGASETHPLLSPNDEFANYEIYDYLEKYRRQVGRLQGSYLRDALGAGLELQRRLGVNPFKYGFVGASDLHGGLSVSAQADYAGSHWTVNFGSGSPSREQVERSFAGTQTTEPPVVELLTSSGNLTGVWAEANTRQSIYDALRRRETFATSGSRLKFRFFGGWRFADGLLEKSDWVARAYDQGVPMGGDLAVKPGDALAPTFAVWAIKDPNGGNLDRVQVIKVWEERGEHKERVYDVTWSGSRRPDAKTGKLPAVGDTVDPQTGKYTNSIGAIELRAIWTDPDFDATRLAAYYLRVLEIPTPRWTTLLAAQNRLPVPKDVPATIQQRGWSSPIWYTPAPK